MTATVPPPRQSARVPEAKVASMFIERWSRRAFAARPVDPPTVRSLLEAARWSPSAGNSQPWLFVYADDAETLANARPVLTDGNRRWADHAPLLLFLFAKNHNAKGAPLTAGQFDSGAAWMSLALQAHALGLNAHAMGGFHHDKVYDVFGVPSAEYTAMAAIAIGYPGDESTLPDDLREREKPSARKTIEEFAYRGRFQNT
ncbi:MAG: nitroreductase family protein [Myxococcaceae bacterium]|nr:nitroreductase family protein [Myxococcaceae bacterium]